MSRLLFSGYAYIEIQGPRVLLFNERCTHYVEYSVIGFEDKVIIRDYRQTGLQAIDFVLDTNDASHFPEDFNGLSRTHIYDMEGGQPMVIELRDGANRRPDYQLWIAVGIDQHIPLHDYELGLVSQMDEKQFAIIALFALEDEAHSSTPYLSLSADPPVRGRLASVASF